MNSSRLNQLLSPILSTPASKRACNNSRSNDDDDEEASASSCFQRTVCLYDWWLVKAEDCEGKRFAVAGFTSREQQAMRVFTSAPIVKRYDVFTLETADGIFIVLKGFINKLRTIENGFLSEIFSHFMFGFPPYWEAYAEQCLGKGFMTGTVLFPDYNKAASDPELAADAGIPNSDSNAIPKNHKKVNSKTKHNAVDINKCSEYVSENTTANASKTSDLPGHAADCCDIGNIENCVSKNLPPSMSCDINNVSSKEDNLAVPAVPSSYYMEGLSERMANLKSRMNGNTGKATKSKIKERASSEGITLINAASGESPVPKGSDADNANPSNVDPAVSLGSSEVGLRVTSSARKTNVLNMCLNINKSSDSPGHAADHNDVGNIKNHASKNLLPLMSCYINNVSSLEDNLAVPAEPSSKHMIASSERMANLKSRMKGSTGTMTKSNTKEQASSEDITARNAASGESPVPKGSDADNANPSNLDPAVSLGSSEVGLRRTSTGQKKNVLNMCPNINESFDSPGHAADHSDVGNTKNHVLKNLPPLMSCDINNASSLDNLAVPSEPSSYHLTRSSERMADAKSRMKGNKRTATKSNTKERASSEDITVRNAASGESPVPKGSDADNANPSNLEPAVSLEGPEVALGITSSGSKTSQKQKENDKSKYGLNYENKNSPTASVPQDSDAIVRCIGEKSPGVETSNLLNVGLTVMNNEPLFTSSIGGEPNIPECVENHDDYTLFFSAMFSAVNMNTLTPSKVDSISANATGSNSGIKSSSCLRSLNSNQRRHSGSSDSVKRGRKKLMSEAFLQQDNLKRCSSHTTIHSGWKIDKLEATESHSVSGIFRKLLGIFKGKEKERVSIVCGLTAKGSKIGFASVLPDETSNTVQNDNLCGELQEPSHSTSVRVNSKQGQGRKKKSQARAPRENKNNIAKYSSGLGGMNHNHKSKTTVGERERNARVDSSRKKARRKINFDVHASPTTPKTEEKSSIVSPESLSLKRSRSGRLLVPSLDFWRNQIAVYDADRKITGIREGVEILKPSKGVASEPPKKKRQWA